MISTKVKLVVAGATIMLAFGAGWTINGWRYEASLREQERKHVKALEERRAELMKEYETQASKDEKAIAKLTTDLHELRDREKVLIDDLDTLRLVTREPRVEGHVEGEHGCEIVANPFSGEFVRVWNRSADPSRR